MSLKKLVLIDGNNFYYRGFFFSQKNKTNELEYCLNMFVNVLEEYPDAKIVFAFDTCKSERRLSLYPEYKAHRKSNMSEEDYDRFKKYLDAFIKIIKFSGYIVMEGGGYEADDYISAFSSMTPSYSILLISSDSDFRQLVSKQFRIFDPTKRILLNEERFEKIVGLKVKQVLDYKCIVGDTADNIKGYPDIGEKIGTRLLEEYGTHEKMMEIIKTKDSLSVKERMLLDTTIYDRNKQLCDLTIPRKDPILKERIIKAAKDKSIQNGELHQILSDFDLSHMLKKVKNVENK